MKNTKQPKPAVSRRGFIQGAGIGGAAVGSGVLQTQAQAAAVAGPSEVAITLMVNGQALKLNVEPRVTLIDALRERLQLTGAKRSCDRGTCGSCTVIMNGKAVYACSILAIDAQGKSIQTIEGLAPAGQLHPISKAFVDNDAQQCGYCTPGFVMAAKHLLDKTPKPSAEQIEQGLAGNLCRCGTYMGLRKAVAQAAGVPLKGKGGVNG